LKNFFEFLVSSSSRQSCRWRHERGGEGSGARSEAWNERWRSNFCSRVEHW